VDVPGVGDENHRLDHVLHRVTDVPQSLVHLDDVVFTRSDDPAEKASGWLTRAGATAITF
jgi:hypothetical protein